MRGTLYKQLLLPICAMFYNLPQLSATCYTNFNIQKNLDGSQGLRT